MIDSIHQGNMGDSLKIGSNYSITYTGVDFDQNHDQELQMEK